MNFRFSFTQATPVVALREREIGRLRFHLSQTTRGPQIFLVRLAVQDPAQRARRDQPISRDFVSRARRAHRLIDGGSLQRYRTLLAAGPRQQ